MCAFEIVFVFQVVRQGPGFRVENRALVILAVIGRMLIYGQQSTQGQKRVVFKNVLSIGVALSEADFVVEDLGVLVELGDAFGEPDGHPLVGAAKDEVRVFVIDGRVRMRAGSVQQNENVIFFGGGNEEAHEVQ